MSDSYLTEKLAEVRAELTRLHQKEALLVKAVLAEPDLGQLHANGTELESSDYAAGFSNHRSDVALPVGMHGRSSLRPRPGWPMTRATPLPDVVQRPTVPPQLALVHSTR